ncbi:hypothetical protein RFI_13059, partial [Reticulomyxa filosa]
ISGMYSSPNPSINNKVNYAPLSTTFSDLNGADGVKLNETALSFLANDTITLDFSKYFPSSTYPEVYIYVLANDYDASPLISLNNSNAIKNKDGTYTTTIAGLSSLKSCGEMTFIVTDRYINNRASTKNQPKNKKLGTYCHANCQYGTANAIRACIGGGGGGGGNYRNSYNTANDWTTYVINNNDVTLQYYNIDSAAAIAGMDNYLTQKIFDAQAQCLIQESSQENEGIFTLNFLNALTGIDASKNLTLDINKCISTCVKLAENNKLEFATFSPTLMPTKQPTYTCNDNKFSGDFNQETTSTAYFNAENAITVVNFSMCAPDTQVYIDIYNPISNYSTNGDCDSNPLSLLASSDYSTYTINVTYLGGTKQAWTLDIVCIEQRRLQSSISLKLANSVTFSVIQSDCTPDNWQQDKSGTGSALSAGPHILYQLDTFQIQGLF